MQIASKAPVQQLSRSSSTPTPQLPPPPSLTRSRRASTTPACLECDRVDPLFILLCYQCEEEWTSGHRCQSDRPARCRPASSFGTTSKSEVTHISLSTTAVAAIHRMDLRLPKAHPVSVVYDVEKKQRWRKRRERHLLRRKCGRCCRDTSYRNDGKYGHTKRNCCCARSR